MQQITSLQQLPKAGFFWLVNHEGDYLYKLAFNTQQMPGLTEL